MQEEHHADGSEATNTIVRLAAGEPSTPEVIVSGPDFVADPRWRPDGAAFCWLEWDHPDMPWDATRLTVDEGGVRTVLAGGDQRESICQPTWAADGSLWFSSDRSGFWSLYRWTANVGIETMVDLGLDIGFPQWVFGQTCFALLRDGRVAFVFRDGGLDQLAVREVDGTVRMVDGDLTCVELMLPIGSAVVAIVASPTAEPQVARIDLSGTIEVPVPPREVGLDPDWFSDPTSIDFPTVGDATAHALFYPPTNPHAAGPDGERPPLLVLIHGGPTSAARSMLRLSYQYWTSRGLRGRRRQLPRLDRLRAGPTATCCGASGASRMWRTASPSYGELADEGLVDPDRCCIRGGSAGGFTVLAALAFHDAFAAGASHYGVADLGVLAEETHKFESRYLDGLVGPWPEARATYDARSPIHHLDGIDRPLAVFQGLDDMVVPPNQAEMIVEGLRGPGASRSPTRPSKARATASARPPTSGRPSTASSSFYAQVLGFDLPAEEGIDPIAVDDLGRAHQDRERRGGGPFLGAGPRVPWAREAVRRATRRRRRQLLHRPWRDLRPARAERRRQDHDDLHDLRPPAPRRR